MLTRAGNYLISYRGLDRGSPDDLAQAYVIGYRPLLMKRRNADGSEQFAPMNLVSRWYWVDGGNDQEVTKDELAQALLAGQDYRPEIVVLFDADRNGEVDETELRLDSDEKVERIRSLLTDQGVAEPVLRAELRAYHLHHAVKLGDASRDCGLCHEENESAAFDLADHVPGGILPSRFHGASGELQAQWLLAPDGSLKLPQPSQLSTAKAR
jgi:hypothetical protein